MCRRCPGGKSVGVPEEGQLESRWEVSESVYYIRIFEAKARLLRMIMASSKKVGKVTEGHYSEYEIPAFSQRYQVPDV